MGKKIVSARLPQLTKFVHHVLMTSTLRTEFALIASASKKMIQLARRATMTELTTTLTLLHLLAPQTNVLENSMKLTIPVIPLVAIHVLLPSTLRTELALIASATK